MGNHFSKKKNFYFKLIKSFKLKKADLRKHLNPEQVPLLCELKNQDEDIEDFKKINEPQHYLLRWINFHLKNAGSDKEVKNFGEDLKVFY